MWALLMPASRWATWRESTLGLPPFPLAVSVLLLFSCEYLLSLLLFLLSSCLCPCLCIPSSLGYAIPLCCPCLPLFVSVFCPCLCLLASPVCAFLPSLDACPGPSDRPPHRPMAQSHTLAVRTQCTHPAAQRMLRQSYTFAVRTQCTLPLQRECSRSPTSCCTYSVLPTTAK